MTVTTIASIAATLARSPSNQTSRAAAVFNSILPPLGAEAESASGDAANIAATIALQNQASQLRIASQNIAQSASLLASAEQGAGEILRDIGRLKEIAAQAASADLSEAERTALVVEFSSLRARIDRVARSTRFGNEALLDGTSPQLKLSQENQKIANLSINSLTEEALFKGATLDIRTVAGARAAGEVLGQAQDYTAAQLDTIRALQGGLDFVSGTLQTAIANQDAARSTLDEDDFTLALLGARSPLAADPRAATAQTNRLPANLLSLLSE